MAPAGAEDAPPGEGAHRKGMKFLTPEEQAQLQAAKDKVFATNPDLKTEDDSLKNEMHAAREGHQKPPQELIQRLMEHDQKMKEALLQADPTLQPILDKIAEHRKENREGQSAGGPNK